MKKSVSLLLALLVFFSAVQPTVGWALTSGPSQPEFSSFTPFEQSSLVDNFTGDFKYNIPLFEMDGYPINLAYQSSSSPEAEASWVGLGWNLNPGSIARNVRGLPDDFNGNGDQVTTENKMKPREVFTAKLNITPKGELVGFPITGQISLKKLQLGLKFDNYYGLSFEYGLGLTTNTVGKSRVNSALTIGYSSQGGYSLTPQFTLAFAEDKARESSSGNNPGSISLGIPFNGEQGFTGLQLGVNGQDGRGVQFGHSRTIPFGSRSFTPQLINDKQSLSLGGTFPLGIEGFFTTAQVDVTGAYSNEHIKNKQTTADAYGYIYHHKADADKKDVITDYNRENDAVISPELPLLPVAYATYDYYSVSGQGVGGNYRPYRAQAPATFDEMAEHKSDGGDLGIDVGATNILKLGVNLALNFSSNRVGAWTEKSFADVDLNSIVSGSSSSMPAFNAFYTNNEVSNTNKNESVCFKRAGELNESDQDYFQRFKGEKAAAIGIGSNDEFLNGLKYNTGKGAQASSSNPINGLRANRMVRSQTFEQLTATQARIAGLDKNLPIMEYFSNETGLYQLYNQFDEDNTNKVKRDADFRKGHHISEVKVTREDGAKFYYGLPVYQLEKREYTMAVNASVGSEQRRTQLITYQPGEMGPGNGSGMDNFYQMTRTSAYVTNYLLTAMVSSDYIDLTQNGPTFEDIGTYIRFNYKQTHGKTTNPYKWRTPVSTAANQGNLSEGNYCITNDNKAVVTYGSKEVYYIQNMVSKNYVAEFYTSPRKDAYGVINEHGGFDASNPLHQLDSIRVFALSDRTDNRENAVPIKTVHFEYDYTLCPGTPNSFGPGKGKLTLKKVYFTHRYNGKGALNPYTFKYSNNPSYAAAQDIWGMKATPLTPGQAAAGQLTNSEFPYVNQKESQPVKDANASAWLLDEIQMPTGGTISVNYEADNYAFVQDRRAMQMFQVRGFSNNSATSPGDLKNELFAGNKPNNYLYFDIDTSKVQTLAQFQKLYTQYIKELYFRCYVDLTGDDRYEFVAGFAEMESSGMNRNDKLGWVKLKDVKLEEKNRDSPTSPIAKLGWQNTRMYMNQLINPPLNETALSGNFEAQLRGLKNKLQKILKLVNGFNGTLRDFGFAKKVNSSRSYIRLNSPELAKTGGGARVKKLTFSDNWNKMAGGNYAGGTYGYTYNYTTKHEGFGMISSGVAQWEPSQGGDENPFRLPIAYSKDRFLAPNDQLVRELPVAQALYPNGDVGYSKIEVTEIKQNAGSKGVGSNVYQFYTAKDFPIISDRIGPNFKPSQDLLDPVFELFNIQHTHKMYMSQGVSLEFSNMHGVQKSEEVYSDGGSKPITKVEYFYKQIQVGLTPWNDPIYKLVNETDVMRPSGQVSKGVLMGVDFDVSCDFREYRSADIMGRTNLNLDLSGPTPFVFPLFALYPGYEADKSILRTASMIKTTSRTPILDRVVRTDLSSVVTERPLVFDGVTGSPVVTALQNQYDDQYYKLNIPAYWAYSEMGPAYERMLNQYSSTSGSLGELKPGDVVSDGQKMYWVVDQNGNKVLMDYEGNPGSGSIGSGTLVKTSARNQLTQQLLSLTCKQNPIRQLPNNVFKLSFQDIKVIDAEAMEYTFEGTKDCSCNRGFIGNFDNPYTNGAKNHGTMVSSYKYLIPRTHSGGEIATVDPRNDGTYSTLQPIWSPIGGVWKFKPNGWVATTTVELRNTNNMDIQTVDALKLPSAIRYTYNQKIPKSIIQNSTFSDFFFDHFEDSYSAAEEDCLDKVIRLPDNISRNKAHSGNTSIKVSPKSNAGVKINLVCPQQ